MWILNYRITNENGNVKILQVGSRTGSKHFFKNIIGRFTKCYIYFFNVYLGFTGQWSDFYNSCQKMAINTLG
jgi:hypothetical protein